MAVELVAALDAACSRYPSHDCRCDLAETDLANGNGAFVMASLDGTEVGRGAVRFVDDGVAEWKRIFAVPARRGHGMATALGLLAASEVRSLAISRVLLKTGVRSPEALALFPWADTRRSISSLLSSTRQSASV